jgi:hypothetical protein
MNDAELESNTPKKKRPHGSKSGRGARSGGRSAGGSSQVSIKPRKQLVSRAVAVGA